MKNEILHKPNQLINLIPESNITVTERKAYNIMLKYAQNKLKFEDYQSNTFSIPRNVLHKNANLKNDDQEYIYKRIENLMRTIVRIYEGDERHSKNWKKSFNLLSSFGKSDDNFNYEFELNQFVINALKEQKFFTPLDLMMINSLDSQYSIIFYELAVEYQKYKIPKMSIERVRQITNTQDEYKRFDNFRRRVLDTACEEISQKTDIILTYTTEKRGRRIAFIDFKIDKKQEEFLNEPSKTFLTQIEVKKQEYPQEVLEVFKLLPPSEQVESNKRELVKLLTDHSFRYLKADIEYAKNSQPDNFMGFIKASCGQGHYSAVELEKKEQKEEAIRKRMEELQRRKELEEKIEQKAKKKALEKYELLSEIELERYDEEYEKITKLVPGKFRPAKKDYIIGALEDRLKDELRDFLFN